MTNDFSLEDFVADTQRSGRLAAEAREELALAAHVLSRGIFRLSNEQWPQDRQVVYQEDLAHTLDDAMELVGELIYREASLDLAAAADSLRGWAALIATQSSFVGAAAVSRAVYESCVLTAAVCDPTLTVEIRAQRALTRRLSRLHASVRFADIVNSGDTKEFQAEIDRILGIATEKGWSVRRARFGVHYLGERFSVEGLTEEGIGTTGLGEHAWRATSSLVHGEHPEIAQTWIRFDWKQVPSYLPALWSTGVIAGTEHALRTVSEYVGASVLQAEWTEMSRAWDRVCSQLSGWRRDQ
ncbi:hypothetical protein [Nocardioides campestrisoli]|uniref:hypothetical protein n=1 Tax=Nocardioides campestrisoli TaxID=2736757 RepID=UPI00163D4BFD|nr:hypothetical protein [Nocardioides campestrisoli]